MTNRMRATLSFFFCLAAAIGSTLAAIWVPSDQWASTAGLAWFLWLLASMWFIVASTP